MEVSSGVAVSGVDSVIAWPDEADPPPAAADAGRVLEPGVARTLYQALGKETKVVVELGAGDGRVTSYIMANALRAHVFAIDPWHDEDDAETFTTNCLELVERFASVTGFRSGVEIKEVAVVEGVCQVCGTEMTEAVLCARCRTPHHKECWEYMGRCSTFACGETGTLSAEGV